MLKDNLKRLRHMANLTQPELAQEIGTNQKVVSSWEMGVRKPRPDMIQKIADYFGVTTDFLLSGENHAISGVRIPVLGDVRAGVPLYATENIVDYEEISPNLQGEFFALRVRGDSMAPRIVEGDIVIVEKREVCNSGDICVVMIDGELATIKRVDIKPHGLMLMPFNNKYEPSYFTDDEVKSLPVSVIGKVIELRGKL